MANRKEAAVYGVGMDLIRAGEQLSEWRESMGYGVAELAIAASKRLNLGQSPLKSADIHRFEFGSEAPSYEYAQALEQIFVQGGIIKSGELLHLFRYDKPPRRPPTVEQSADVAKFVFERFISSQSIADVVKALISSFSTATHEWNETDVTSILHDMSYTELADPMTKVTPEDFRAAERILVGQRLYHGRLDAARSGYYQSGPVPYGYQRTGHPGYKKGNKQITPHEPEAGLVRFIFKEYLRVKSLNKVIEALHQQGTRTRRGKKWSRMGVSWILRNDTYIGRVHFSEINVKGKHQPLIAPTIFYKARKLLRLNDKFRQREAALEQRVTKPQ